MSNQVYKYIALAFLFGAPFIVQILSNVVPGLPQAAEAAKEAPGAPVEETEAATPAPAPTPQRPQQAASALPGLADAKPSLDTQGIDPTAALEHDFADAPPPPPAPPKPAYDEKIGPPPPQRPAYMDR